MKKDTSKATLASWSDREAKIKSLAEGRKTAFQIKKEKTGCSFDPETILKISINKYTKSGNQLALYLISKGIDIVPFKDIIRFLNYPGYYKKEGSQDEAIKTVVELSNKQKENTLTIEKATELVNNGINTKPTGEYRLNLKKKSNISREYREATKGLSTEMKVRVIEYIKTFSEGK
jgi:hypothetical protein